MHVQASTWPPRQGRETCCFSNTIHIILLNTLASYTRRSIPLEKCQNSSVAESFFHARLRNKCIIVCEGTGYPSNRGPRGVIVLG